MARSAGAARGPQIVGAELLAKGRLAPVPEIAEQVLGAPISPDTALRWSTRGRRGLRLATAQGRLRQRLTTVAALHAWLVATAPGATPAAPPPTRDHAADAVLASFGLPREGGL
jgi:hypothetical protein